MGQKIPRQKTKFINLRNPSPSCKEEVLHVVDVSELSNKSKKLQLIAGMEEGLRAEGCNMDGIIILNYK